MSALLCDHHTRCCLFVYADGWWSAVAVSVVVGSNHLILVLVRCCGYSSSNNSMAPPHLFLTCYCCCIVIFLISTHIILDTSVRITLSWHEMSCSKWHSVAYSDFWVEIVFKSLALKWHSYPCFIASKMHPWYPTETSTISASITASVKHDSSFNSSLQCMEDTRGVSQISQ